MKKFLLAGAALAALASGAQAADLGVQRVAVPSAILVPAFSWTGFYAGAHIGWGSARSSYRDNTGTFFNSSLTSNGVFGGVQVGYNWQINQFVLGVEGDVSAGGLSKRTTDTTVGSLTFGDSYRTSVPFLGSLRVRAGLAADRALFYVTGGLGVATFSDKYFDASVGPTGTTFSSSSTRVGYTVGGGIEYAFTQNWTAKVEYLYYGFGDRSNIFTANDRFSQNIHTVKLGVNYLFSTGPGAVVARY
ncbi:outer membrane protein [Phreatobacter stygius]|uniref:Porin family protein n=1 Tax=Phreatobacter stygius TaxID=1940610 RepID=A0A4D7B0F5_9HYPH|nr:outer membrane protein [Phreatobacter stygius]QCI63500.1 porin family protein [Phreatobacter stygius]